ncbi:hypothetical protein B0H34DRAFT_801486 [Crassisporium funariophilum]|nr:hypothetical protein B0H34DRAFT_801486 [Crassisporium funariophilum]
MTSIYTGWVFGIRTSRIGIKFPTYLSPSHFSPPPPSVFFVISAASPPLNPFHVGSAVEFNTHNDRSTALGRLVLIITNTACVLETTRSRLCRRSAPLHVASAVESATDAQIVVLERNVAGGGDDTLLNVQNVALASDLGLTGDVLQITHCLRPGDCDPR